MGFVLGFLPWILYWILVALIEVLSGGPSSGSTPRPRKIRRPHGFRVITTGITWLWVAVFAAMKLLSLRGEADRDQHLHYAGAGHLIRFGNFPTDAQWTNGISLGGTRQGQAAAQRDATGRVLSFLDALMRYKLTSRAS
jgi:BAAT / Acyl-CoA thioester hydrolase C terminal